MEPPRFCSRCGKPVVVGGARFCKECGATLPSTVILDQDNELNPWTALILSLIPGLGHWYKGLRKRALMWFVVVVLSYNILPAIGLIMHAICAVNAAIGGALPAGAMQRIYGARRTLRASTMSRASR